MSKKNQIIFFCAAIVVTLAVLVIYRRTFLPVRLNDKIDDLATTEKSVPVLIYNAAFERLQRHFTDDQSALLATLMVAQSKLETANYTSAVYLQNNNAFGYKYYADSIYQAGMGLAAPASENDNYGIYANVADSAREVADWIGRRSADFTNVTGVYDYAAALSNDKYFTEAADLYAADMNHYFTTNIA